MILKSTKQEVFDLPFVGIGSAPWPSGYQRILIPANCKNGNKAVTQIVSKSKLKA